ncbi:threonine synthase [bacterium (candidate division B38) B3_B38]|nr:MAG: threonine synthase [bacterium (candidate division B38) B3_B38]
MSFFIQLECSQCGKSYSPREIHNLCTCGSSLMAVYDLAAAAKSLSREALSGRPPNLWRYRELLPVFNEENIVTLGEGFTPLMKAEELGRSLGFRHLYIKDESLNPTASFKARGLAVAVSKAKELGIEKGTLPSAGNAAGALAAYAARAGIKTFVAMPADTPEAFSFECRAYGAEVRLVEGLISDAARLCREKVEQGWFDFSTLKEPYRAEGKKTMGYELAEQMNWELPEVIIYPTGGGTGIIGMWKAFAEMEELGWVGKRKPRMVAVQSEGCAPVVKAFQSRQEVSEAWKDARTLALGIRVPHAFADRLILKALYESEGTAVAVSEEEIVRSFYEISQKEGILPAPEGAATWAGLKRLREMKLVDPDERVVLFNTGSGLKYMEVMRDY